MSGFLRDTDRRQALAWYAVLGFDLQTIADHYGLTVDQIRQELKTERENREAAGKSPQPVPVRTGPTGKVPEHAGLLLNCLVALEGIVRVCEKSNQSRGPIAWIMCTAEQALEDAGFLS